MAKGEPWVGHPAPRRNLPGLVTNKTIAVSQTNRVTLTARSLQVRNRLVICPMRANPQGRRYEFPVPAITFKLP